jgi:hypothetical protein
VQDKNNRGRTENWERKRGLQSPRGDTAPTKINTNCWLNLASSSLVFSLSLPPCNIYTHTRARTRWLNRLTSSHFFPLLFFFCLLSFTVASVHCRNTFEMSEIGYTMNHSSLSELRCKISMFA